MYREGISGYNNGMENMLYDTHELGLNTIQSKYRQSISGVHDMRLAII